MGSWVSVVGGVLVLLVLWDVFNSLLYPTGRGRISHSVMAGVWRLTRHARPRIRRVAGPLALVAAIGTWGLLVLLGGALVYWPHLPSSFGYAPSTGPGAGFVDAFYLSVVTTSTLGYGDIVPTVAWLRLVAPLQALVGFALLTAAVAWFLEVYPALTRRRSLSLRLAVLERAGVRDRIHELTPETSARTLDEISTALAQVRTDLTQYAESYYFEDSTPAASLALTVRHAADLAAAGVQSRHEDVRFAAEVLEHTLDELAEVLDGQFLRTRGSRADVLAAYAREHRHRTQEQDRVDGTEDSGR
jgi:hypothetical protein